MSDQVLATLEKARDNERGSERSRSSVEARIEALKLSVNSRDGGAALLGSSSEVNALGSVASLIEISAGWESAITAALGSLLDAVVVGRLSDAIDALTLLKRENGGRAEILVMGSIEAISNQGNASLPSGAYRAIDLIKSERLVRSLSHVLANTVVVENLQLAHTLLQSNSDLQ